MDRSRDQRTPGSPSRRLSPLGHELCPSPAGAHGSLQGRKKVVRPVLLYRAIGSSYGRALRGDSEPVLTWRSIGDGRVRNRRF